MSTYSLPPIIIGVLSIAIGSHVLLVGPSSTSTQIAITPKSALPSQPPFLVQQQSFAQSRTQATPKIESTPLPIKIAPRLQNVSPQAKIDIEPLEHSMENTKNKKTLIEDHKKSTLKPITEAPTTTHSLPKLTTINTSKNSLEKPETHYLIQLIGSPDQADIERFKRIHQQDLMQHHALKTINIERGQKTWILLLLGPFDGYSKAKNTLAQLPTAIQKYEPWIRTTNSLPQPALP